MRAGPIVDFREKRRTTDILEKKLNLRTITKVVFCRFLSFISRFFQNNFLDLVGFTKLQVPMLFTLQVSLVKWDSSFSQKKKGFFRRVQATLQLTFWACSEELSQKPLR
jgi:hypothetical protein